MEKENTLSILLKIRDRIKEANLNVYEDSIPTSDIIFRKLLSDLVYSEDQALYNIKLLYESNFIFIIHIVEPDEYLKIRGIDGYVVAEKPIIEKILGIYNKRLEKVYEVEKRKLAGAETIIRELMPKIKEYNNTTLGKYLNICIMLDQFIRVINEKPHEFTDEYRISKIKRFLPETETQDYSLEEETENQQTIKEEKVLKRAIDTEEYKELSKMNLSGNWGKAVDKFGVQFLIRVHLRKNEYDIIKKLILQKRIAKEEDLLYLREILNKMEQRSLYEKELREYLNEIKELKRLVQLKINQYYLLRKKYEG